MTQPTQAQIETMFMEQDKGVWAVTLTDMRKILEITAAERAEIERLRRALTFISIFRQSTYVGDPCEYMEDMARQALKDTAAHA